MIRRDFANDPQVLAFVQWLAARLDTIQVQLNIPSHRRFVPSGVNVKVTGFNAVTTAYMWRATGMQNGDWKSTENHCGALASALQAAVAAGDLAGTQEAALRIIEWGGGNQTKGAYPFLMSLGANLVTYLQQTNRAFTLVTADTNSMVPPVEAMNSMLTKVHAFLAIDGLPIYDSRVAVATATLVEAWRQDTLPPHMLAATPIPASLHFPTVNGRNLTRTTVWRKYPNATRPQHLSQYNRASAMAWSSAKIRLGWLMEELLASQPNVFPAATTLPEKMRALEAALFMIGYDVQCLP